MDSYIAILGGTFDPIHDGHQMLIYALVKYAEVESVIIVPTVKNNFKERIPSPYEDRVNMIELMLKSNNFSKPVSVMREDETKDSWPAIELLDRCKSMYLDKKFRFVIGMDCAKDFNKWVSYERILAEYGLVIVDRPGYSTLDVPDDILMHDNVTYIPNASALYVSSTSVRQHIADNKGRDRIPYIAKGVTDYIVQHNLYDDIQPSPPLPEHRYYRKDVFIQEDVCKNRVGDLWYKEYILIMDTRPTDSETGIEQTLCKLFRIPCYEDYGCYMTDYVDALILDNLDGCVPISEDEYNDAGYLLLEFIKESALGDTLIPLTKKADAISSIDRMFRMSRIIINSDYQHAYYKSEVTTDEGELWTTMYIRTMDESVNEDGEKKILVSVTGKPNYETEENNRFMHCIFCVENCDGYTGISKEEYEEGINKFLSDLKEGLQSKDFIY